MKHTPLPFGAALPAVLSVAAMLLATPALAQMAPGTNSSGTLTGPVVGTSQGSIHKEAPPPALPGARTTDNDPAPADRPASEMKPTDALFNSVNRGDITSARDAIARGADLDAQNVLGLTPIDLAVDLGRNDITFLLLSLRTNAGGALPAVKNSGKPAGPVPRRRQAASRGPCRRDPAGIAAGGAAICGYARDAGAAGWVPWVRRGYPLRKAGALPRTPPGALPLDPTKGFALGTRSSGYRGLSRLRGRGPVPADFTQRPAAAAGRVRQLSAFPPAT